MTGNGQKQRQCNGNRERQWNGFSNGNGNVTARNRRRKKSIKQRFLAWLKKSTFDLSACKPMRIFLASATDLC
jgi:hypothetical protein